MTKEQITLDLLGQIVGRGIKQGTEGTTKPVLFHGDRVAGYGKGQPMTEEQKYSALATAVFEAKKLLETYLGVS